MSNKDSAIRIMTRLSIDLFENERKIAAQLLISEQNLINDNWICAECYRNMRFETVKRRHCYKRLSDL